MCVEGPRNVRMQPGAGAGPAARRAGRVPVAADNGR